MTDSFVTQCLHCQTRFRASHAQLTVARGMVRCGSCLQVFNAAKQLLDEHVSSQTRPAVIAPQPQVDPPLAPAVEQPPVIAPHSVAVIVPARLPVQQPVRPVDLDSLDLDDLDVELARLEQREIQLPETFGRAGHAHDRQDQEPVESFSARRDEPDVGHEHWDHSLGHDDVEQLPELHAEVIEEPAHHNGPSPVDEPSANPADRKRTEPSVSMAPDDLDEEPPLDHRLDVQSAPQPQHAGERFSALDAEDDRLLEHHPEDDDDDQPPVKGKRTRNEPGLRDPALMDLVDDPLQLAWEKPKPRRGRRGLWLVLALIALCGLAGQYVWYHFDELARQDQYRSLFQDICPAVGCKVPSRVDINLLKSSNLVVRSHPEFQGALVVDAIIYNRASFAQPFPLLELRFADAGGQLIASRRFKPGEYLSGELAGKDEMPPQTPIHIALDILDPGPKAMNYSLSFRSPE